MPSDKKHIDGTRRIEKQHANALAWSYGELRYMVWMCEKVNGNAWNHLNTIFI